MSTNAELKIGDRLFRRVELSGIWEYEVIERRENPEGMQYVVRSLSCTHRWKCELLISEDDKGDLRYVRMTNNHEDDDQSYWHNPGLRFCRTKSQARVDACKLFVKGAQERVKKAKESLAAAEKYEKEISEMMAVALTECEEVGRG